jgi:hypothetical protein
MCPVSHDFPGAAVALPLLPQAYVVRRDQESRIVYPFLMPKEILPFASRLKYTLLR